MRAENNTIAFSTRSASRGRGHPGSRATPPPALRKTNLGTPKAGTSKSNSASKMPLGRSPPPVQAPRSGPEDIAQQPPPQERDANCESENDDEIISIRRSIAALNTQHRQPLAGIAVSSGSTTSATVGVATGASASSSVVAPNQVAPSVADYEAEVAGLRAQLARQSITMASHTIEMANLRRDLVQQFEHRILQRQHDSIVLADNTLQQPTSTIDRIARTIETQAQQRPIATQIPLPLHSIDARLGQPTPSLYSSYLPQTHQFMAAHTAQTIGGNWLGGQPPMNYMTSAGAMPVTMSNINNMAHLYGRDAYSQQAASCAPYVQNGLNSHTYSASPFMPMNAYGTQPIQSFDHIGTNQSVAGIGTGLTVDGLGPTQTAAGFGASHSAAGPGIGPPITGYNQPFAGVGTSHSAAGVDLSQPTYGAATGQFATGLSGQTTNGAEAGRFNFMPSMSPAETLRYYGDGRRRRTTELPAFSGKPEEWPAFIAMYRATTADERINDLENLQRLQRSLKGSARLLVDSMLVYPHGVNGVMECLQQAYGRPEMLVRTQIDAVRKLNAISENRLEELIPFAIQIRNFTHFLDFDETRQHLANPMLLDELVAKLPLSKRYEWTLIAERIRPYPNMKDFSFWLNDVSRVINKCSTLVAPAKPIKKHVLHARESEAEGDLCAFCSAAHSTKKCAAFLKLSPAKRWVEVKRLRLCFGCLQGDHMQPDCDRSTKCGVDGCQLTYHCAELHDPYWSKKGKSRKPVKPKPAAAKKDSSGTSISKPTSSDTVDGAVLNCRSISSGSRLLYKVVPVTLYGKDKSVDTSRYWMVDRPCP